MKRGIYIRLGKRDVTLTKPSHVRGVMEGNEGPGMRRSAGAALDGHQPQAP